MRDSRPNHFYPTARSKLENTANFYAMALGTAYQLQFDKYWSRNKNQVLAYNVFVCNTGGNPPFTESLWDDNELR